VILIVSDDQTWESIDKMPYLKAQSEWFKFSNAFVNVSLCCPARANILSGLYSHHSGVEDNFDGQSHDESSNLAVWLNDAGYNTALIGKYLNSFPWDNPDYIPAGWDEFQTFLEADDNSNWYYNYLIFGQEFGQNKKVRASNNG
jgi:arylsulfatase A-like enzyme